MAYADHMFNFEDAPPARSRPHSRRSLVKFSRRHAAAAEWLNRGWPDDFTKTHQLHVVLFNELLEAVRIDAEHQHTCHFIMWFRENMTGFPPCPLLE